MVLVEWPVALVVVHCILVEDCVLLLPYVIEEMVGILHGGWVPRGVDYIMRSKNHRVPHICAHTALHDTDDRILYSIIQYYIVLHNYSTMLQWWEWYISLANLIEHPTYNDVSFPTMLHST